MALQVIGASYKPSKLLANSERPRNASPWNRTEIEWALQIDIDTTAFRTP